VLQYYEHFVNIQNAIAREKQLKGWSRQKKEALFRTTISEEWRRTEEKMRDQEKRGE
jgi:putative endonuclease